MINFENVKALQEVKLGLKYLYTYSTTIPYDSILKVESMSTTVFKPFTMDIYYVLITLKDSSRVLVPFCNYIERNVFYLELDKYLVS